jgi:undecaprenyl-diphosphatase
MIEQLETYDQKLSIWINQLHNPFVDDAMWFISGLTPFLLLILLAYLSQIYRVGFPRAFLFLGFLILAVACSDLLSVHGFKNVFERYRPSHNLDIAHLIKLYVRDNGEPYMGGLFGFVSSHAANFASLSTFILLSLRPKWSLVALVVLLHLMVIYSRVYLGVHYVADVLVGTLLGMVCGWLVYQVYNKVKTKFKLLP